MEPVDHSHIPAPSRKPTLSIRARLVILVLLAVVPLILDRARLLEQTRVERVDDAGKEMLSLAQRGAEGQREIIVTAKALQQVMARAYVSVIAKGANCQSYLANLTSDVPWIFGMSIAGANGIVTCSTAPSAIGVNISDRPYFRSAMASREFVVSDYLISRSNQKPALVAVYPTQALDPSVAPAAIITSIDLQWIGTLIASLEQRPGSNVLLIDGAGTVVAGDPSVAAWTGKRIGGTAFLERISRGNEGTVRTEGLDGVRRIFGFVRIPANDTRLVIGVNEAQILQTTDRETMLAYIQLGLFALLVLLIAWFGGERLIVEPIRSLARTAERFGRGDLQARAPPGAWAKEFVPLTAALDDMAQKLADREDELRAANAHLQELASSDALSGLANRRGFDARLAADWQRASKFARPVALLMIDIDHFKQFNDRYGHVEGDVCLRRVAKLLRETASGEDDLPARYGGEEFALLLPGAGVDAALALGERLRRSVEDMFIAHASSPSGQVTISVGVASLVPGVGEDARHLVEAADIALYAAKRRGRNTVVAHGAIKLAEAS
jgi:diguanylate cyclase (GGDEF)-like protein